MKRAPPWPADKVERWPLDRIIPDAHNPRAHSDAQVAQIAASMKEWGWTNPILVDEKGHLIAGHGRLLAAHQLGLTEAPVMVARGWTEAQKRAYLIADNKLALNASWDTSLLSAELDQLGSEGFAIDLLGFTQNELDQLSAPVTNQETEWQGMPEFAQDDQMGCRKLIVHFATPDAVDTFARLVRQTIGERARFIWFPEEPRQKWADRQYVESDES
jgi:hypothetical protein